MKRVLILAAMVCVLAVAAFGQGNPLAPKTTLKVGDMAPDFTLTNTAGEPVKLSDFRGKKNVVLAFYVLAFTGGWTKELQAYQSDIAKFEAANTQVLGISMDSFASNQAFGKQIAVTFPLLSDWRRTTTKDYGLYNETSGYGSRASFVINKEGKIESIEQGRTAVDPTGAYQVCDLIEKRKADAAKKPIVH